MRSYIFEVLTVYLATNECRRTRQYGDRQPYLDGPGSRLAFVPSSLDNVSRDGRTDGQIPTDTRPTHDDDDHHAAPINQHHLHLARSTRSHTPG